MRYSAEKNIRHIEDSRSSVPTLVCRILHRHQEDTALTKEYVQSAERNLLHTATGLPSAATGVVQESSRRESVYNLSVEECNEFFANGVLVHNCDCTALMLLASMDTMGDILFL